MKKWLTLLCVFTSAILLIIHIVGGKEKLYSELCITEEKKQEIISCRVEAKESLYKTIYFNDYELFFDKDGNRLFYSLIQGDVNAYNPSVECISEKQSVDFAIVGTAITDEVIAAGEEFGILIYTDDEYEYIKLVFTTLPILSIQFERRLEGVADFEPMDFKLFDNRQNATQRITNAEGKIHIRGNASRFYPKRGFRLTLFTDSPGQNQRELNTSLLGMRQDGDWLLYAAMNDTTKIRNVFSSNLWKESCATNNICGVDNGMEYKYVELFMQDRYWGLYALGYPIDSLQLQMVEGEFMYEKDEPEVSEVNIDYYTNGEVRGYSIRELGKNKVPSWEPLKKYYQAMMYANDNYESLRKLVDINNSIDIYLFLNMIQGVDHANLRGNNIIYNIYMTNKICNNGESEVMLYSPWDMDRTWGRAFEEEGRSITAEQNVLMQSNFVHFLLEQGDEEIQEMVVQRYWQLRESTWSDEHLIELITSYEKQIFDSGAYKRDKIRWPEGYYLDEEEDKLNQFKNYVKERMLYMDIYIDDYCN